MIPPRSSVSTGSPTTSEIDKELRLQLLITRPQPLHHHPSPSPPQCTKNDLCKLNRLIQASRSTLPHSFSFRGWATKGYCTITPSSFRSYLECANSRGYQGQAQFPSQKTARSKILLRFQQYYRHIAVSVDRSLLVNLYPGQSRHLGVAIHKSWRVIGCYQE